MKNFRKVLALVLVVATLFSFVAMTASAKEYTDADKVSYTEAVDVLTAIGILNGYTDGTYRPTNTIARAEMAKMIAVLANEGKDNIGDLYASACKFADMTGDAVWAKSYVAYCNQIGIVAGRNATTFDPYGKVTGIETAKMLLCMIGFDAKAQGYVGTNWKVNVLRDAEKVGLLEGFAADFEADKAITREEAANMMLNALLAPMVVGTVSGNIVNISNTVWLKANGFDTTIKNITLTDAIDVYDCYILYGNVLVSNVPVWTNYAGLDVKANDRDCYGNPVTTWRFTNEYGKEIWTASYAHAYDYYYTDISTLETDLDKLDPDSVNEVQYWEDGYKSTVTDTLAEAIERADTEDSGRGVEVKVYIQNYVKIGADHKAVYEYNLIVTVKNTFIGEVASVNNAAGTFTLNAVPYTNLDATFSNANYGFKKDDVVLYWLCTNHTELHDAEIATPVNVDLTETYVAYDNVAPNEHNSYVVGSSKTYYYAKNLGNVVAGSDLAADVLDTVENEKTNTTYDLYLDKFGNIMAWVELENGYETGYAYLVEGTGVYVPNGTTSSGTNLYTATATTVDFDANMVEGDKISKSTFDALRESEEGDGIVGTNWFSGYGYGLLVKYSVINGEKSVDDDYQMNVDVAQRTYDAVLKKDGNIYKMDGTLVANGTSETKYLVRTWNYTKGAYEYKAYDETTLAAQEYDFCGNVAGVNEDNTNKTVAANIQYFTKTIAGHNDALTYVFVNALYAPTEVDAFVLGRSAQISKDLFNKVIGDYTAYDAYINGEKAILAVTEASEFNPATDSYKLFTANLTVIGLVDGDVPVYADLDEVATTYDAADEVAWVYDEGRIWLYNPVTGTGDAAIAEALKPTSDFFAVIAYETSSGYETKVITDPTELNNYYEIDADGNIDFDMSKGYDSATCWAKYEGTSISALYMVLDVNN